MCGLAEDNYLRELKSRLDEQHLVANQHERARNSAEHAIDGLREESSPYVADDLSPNRK